MTPLALQLLYHCADESYDYLKARPRRWWRLGTEKWPSKEERIRHLAAERVKAIVLQHVDP